MRISGIFALGGGGCGYGCIDSHKGYYDDYIYGGYPRYFNIYQGGAWGKYDYRPPACLYGSRFL